MATYTVAAGDLAAHNKVLVASTVDTVDFGGDIPADVEVQTDGTAAIYVTLDGTTPTVGGVNTYRIPAAICVLRLPAGTHALKLISLGTPTYSVTRA